MKLYNPFDHANNPSFFVIFCALVSALVPTSVLLFVIAYTGLGPLLALVILMAIIARVLYFVFKGK